MLNHASKFFALAVTAVSLSLSVEAQTVSKTIALPNSTYGGIVTNPLTNRIYAVTNSNSSTASDTVSVIDGKSDSILANIAVPAGAYIPAINVLTNTVYVASCNFYLNPAPCFVTVINGKTNTVTTTVAVSSVLNGFLAGIAVNPVTNMVYVADNTNQDIAIIDGKTNTLTGTISVGGNPWGLAINPAFNELYVTLGTSDVEIVKAATKEIYHTSTGSGTIDYNVAVDILSGNLYVTNSQFGASTTAILRRTGEILAQVTVGSGAYGVDVDPITHLAFVANDNSNDTSVISGKSLALEATIPATLSTFVSVNPFTRKIYGIGTGIVTVAAE